MLTAGPISTALLEIVPRGTAPWRRLTRDEAEHACTFSKNGELYVDTRTAKDALPESTVYRRGDGWTAVGVLPSVAEAPPFRVNLELITVGQSPSFAAALVRPRDFQPGRKYPVIVNVYGGPTSLMVRSDERQYLMAQWIADHGAVVVAIDNRGTDHKTIHQTCGGRRAARQARSLR